MQHFYFHNVLKKKSTSTKNPTHTHTLSLDRNHRVFICSRRSTSAVMQITFASPRTLPLGTRSRTPDREFAYDVILFRDLFRSVIISVDLRLRESFYITKFMFT